MIQLEASALGELEGATRLRPAVLLALDHTRVAGQEAAALEHGAQLGLEIGERLGDCLLYTSDAADE